MKNEKQKKQKQGAKIKMSERTRKSDAAIRCGVTDIDGELMFFVDFPASDQPGRPRGG